MRGCQEGEVTVVIWAWIKQVRRSLVPATVGLDCDVEGPFQGHALSDPSLAGLEIR